MAKGGPALAEFKNPLTASSAKAIRSVRMVAPLGQEGQEEWKERSKRQDSQHEIAPWMVDNHHGYAKAGRKDHAEGCARPYQF